MKRTVFLLVALLSLSLQINAQDYNHLPPYGLFDTDLRGSVKSITTVSSDTASKLTATVTENYNRAGFLEKVTRKTLDGFTIEETYHYDKSGKLVQMEEDQNNTISYFEYDKLGHLARIVRKSEDEVKKVTTITSDASGRVVAVKEPESISTDTFFYDAKGRVVRHRIGITINDIRYTYDANGNILTDCGKHGCTYNEYNDRGFITSTRYESVKGSVYNRAKYTYPHIGDSHGNWLQRIVNEIDNESVIIETRVIEYYP